MTKKHSVLINVTCPHCNQPRSRSLVTSPAFVTCDSEMSQKGCGEEFLVEWEMVPKVTAYLIKRVPHD